MSALERIVRSPLDALEFTNILLTTDDAVVGATPRDVVWTHRGTTLYRYRSDTAVSGAAAAGVRADQPARDLRPAARRSLVEYLLAEGFDVFLVDWGLPDEEDADMGLDEYVCDELHWAIRETLRASGADELTLMGWCIGATLCAMYCGLDEIPSKGALGTAAEQRRRTAPPARRGPQPRAADDADRRAGLHLRAMGRRSRVRRRSASPSSGA